MKNHIQEILYNYPIQVEQILTLKFQRIWEIRCSKGIFVLKALSFPKQETDFIIGAMAHLSKNNFHRFNEIIPTLKDEKTLFQEGHFYFLSRKLKGREANFHILEDCRQCGRFLAQLHNHAQGYKPKTPYPERVKWEYWPQMIETKKTDLKNFLEIIEKKEAKDSFDYQFRRFIPYYYEEMCAAQEVFYTDAYQRVWQHQREKGGFCHHDLAHHNFLIDKTPQVIDFDYVLADLRCHDIANLLGKILKTNQWEIKPALTAFKAYNRTNPLSQDEIPLLGAMLRFPQDFWQCGLARYSEKNTTDHNTKKLKHWLETRTLRSQGLKELFLRFEEVKM